jgi:hypothetical protein
LIFLGCSCGAAVDRRIFLLTGRSSGALKAVQAIRVRAIAVVAVQECKNILLIATTSPLLVTFAH